MESQCVTHVRGEKNNMSNDLFKDMKIIVITGIIVGLSFGLAFGILIGWTLK